MESCADVFVDLINSGELSRGEIVDGSFRQLERLVRPPAFGMLLGGKKHTLLQTLDERGIERFAKVCACVSG